MLLLRFPLFLESSIKGFVQFPSVYFHCFIVSLVLVRTGYSIPRSGFLLLHVPPTGLKHKQTISQHRQCFILLIKGTVHAALRRFQSYSRNKHTQKHEFFLNEKLKVSSVAPLYEREKASVQWQSMGSLINKKTIPSMTITRNTNLQVTLIPEFF